MAATQQRVYLRLPRDCISIIVDQIPIRNVVDVCLGLCMRADIREVIDHRKSYRRLLSEIVPDPDQLLASMHQHGYILTCGKIPQYFTPTDSTYGESWMFLVPGNVSDVIASLEIMGIEHIDCTTSIDASQINIVEHLCISKHVKQKRMVLVRSIDCHPLDYVLRFSVSPMQCFITYFGAFHMYGKLSSQMQMNISTSMVTAWQNHRDNHMKTRCPSHSRIHRLLRDLVQNFDMGFDLDGGDLIHLSRSINENVEAMYHIMDSDEPESTNIERCAMHIKERFNSNDTTSVENVVLEHWSLLGTYIVACIEPCDCIDNEAQKYIHSYLRAGYTPMDFLGYVLKSGRRWYGNTPMRSYGTRSLLDSECDAVFFSYPGSDDKSTSKKQIELYSWYEYCKGIGHVGNEASLCIHLKCSSRDISIASV